MTEGMKYVITAMVILGVLFGSAALRDSGKSNEYEDVMKYKQQQQEQQYQQDLKKMEREYETKLDEAGQW